MTINDFSAKKTHQAIPSARRFCATCELWGGDRTLIQNGDAWQVSYPARCSGACRGGVWAQFGSLAHQYCDAYQRWKLLSGQSADPVVLSPIALLIRQIRMSSTRAGPLPVVLTDRIDQLRSDIECWHLQHPSAELTEVACSEQEQVFTDVVCGLFDAFYYLGWSTRKPVAELTEDDFVTH
jgi:hypothetical protein